MIWRKDYIFFANLLPAFVNFFTSIFLAKFVGFELAGVWFFYRSVCQVTASFSPGFLQSLLLKKEGYTLQKEILLIAKRLTCLWFIANFCIFIIILSYIDTELNYDLMSLILLYWFSLTFYGFYALIIRIKLDSKGMLKLSVFDAVASLIILIALFFANIELFIFLSSLKFILKGVYARKIIIQNKLEESFSSITINSYLLSAKELLQSGGGLSFKGAIHTFSQYGDKFVLGLLVSKEVLGVVGLGGSMAIPFALVMSSFYTWALPYLNSNDFISKNSKILISLFGLFLFYPLFSFFILFFYDFTNQEFIILYLALCFLMLQVYLNFSCSLLFKKYGTWKPSTIQLFILLITYIVIFFTIELGIIIALTCGSLFLIISTSCILFPTIRFKSLYVGLFGLHFWGALIMNASYN